MLKAPKAEDPVVLSYLALRKAVGCVALGLPFVLAIPWWLLRDHALISSISGYYYTGMRNLFVGSLCAISMFMLCCRGYDWKDEIAGMLSSVFSLGVAFCPTTPDCHPTKRQCDIGIVHYIFAALLFLTLAYFCLVLFQMSAENKKVTRKKLQRNRVYTICGYAILASILLLLVFKFTHATHLFWTIGPTFFFETTSLIAFGVAWLIKGETFLKDENSGVLILSVNHGDQIVPLKDELLIPETIQNKEKLRTLIRKMIASRKVDLICEESDPRHLSIAQEEAFKHEPRIPWKNIHMTSQERLEAGIWEALLYRPYDFKPIDEHNAIQIEHRVPEDDVREKFFRDEILRAVEKTGAQSVLVICGDMHTEQLKTKLESSGHQVETNHGLISEKHWK